MSALPKSTIEQFLSVLNITNKKDNIYSGISIATDWPRIFGGHVLAQAVIAACKEKSDHHLHALHAQFLHPGTVGEPIDYRVETTRRGKSFTSKTIAAMQNNKQIGTALCSFHKKEQADFSHNIKMPDIVLPEENALLDNKTLSLPFIPQPLPTLDNDPLLELRPMEIERYTNSDFKAQNIHLWFRIPKLGQQSPHINKAALTFCSDLPLLDAALARHSHTIFDNKIMAASLDHTIWFHQESQLSDWHLYVMQSPIADNARALSQGSIFSSSGRLIATVMQEGVIRKRK